MDKFQEYKVRVEGVKAPEKRLYKELTPDERRAYHREAYNRWYANSREELLRKKRAKRWAKRCKKMEEEGFSFSGGHPGEGVPA